MLCFRYVGLVSKLQFIDSGGNIAVISSVHDMYLIANFHIDGNVLTWPGSNVLQGIV